jgi:hypothetical protein
MTVTNEQVCKDVLRHITPDFYGEVTLQFHRGVITHTKTTQSKKYNTTQGNTPEAHNEQPYRK